MAVLAHATRPIGLLIPPRRPLPARAGSEAARREAGGGRIARRGGPEGG
jgi:hypothetical protein